MKEQMEKMFKMVHMMLTMKMRPKTLFITKETEDNTNDSEDAVQTENVDAPNTDV